MSESNGNARWPDPSYFENRRNFSQDELLKYKDKYIAWSYDGTRIVDSDEDGGTLYDRLKAAGYDMGRTVISNVVYSDDSYIPSLWDASIE